MHRESMFSSLISSTFSLSRFFSFANQPSSKWKTAIFCDHRTFSVNIAMCILSRLIKLLHIFPILYNWLVFVFNEVPLTLWYLFAIHSVLSAKLWLREMKQNSEFISFHFSQKQHAEMSIYIKFMNWNHCFAANYISFRRFFSFLLHS